ncbi:MAG: GtrA family protein [Acutalibacteraceae bacterium]|nr:GtrA family protein [Acutalibacteraceae bacterium]
MQKIKELFNKYREIILYLVFGVGTTLVNIAAYFVSSRIGIGTAVSTVIAWILSVLFAYVTNRKYVFESKATGAVPILKETANFFLCRLATGLLDLVIMVVFVDWLHFNDMIMKILSNIIVIVINYVASKLLIFKNKN